MAGKQPNDGDATETKQMASMTPKSVSIANPEQNTSYFDLGEPAMGTSSSRSRRASGAKRLTGRSSKASLERLPNLGNLLLGDGSRESDATGHSQSDHYLHAHSKLHGAVNIWLEEERTKWKNRTAIHEKSYVQVAFEGLEKILTDHPIVKHQRPVFPGPKRLSSSRRIRHLSLISHASDTEHSGDDPIIPATDEVLDNSKTVGNNGIRDAGDWLSFKNEIIKLAHTLRLKGWRRIALNAGDDIRVERLSGALTNAVYVVIPTRDVLKTPSGDSGQLGASKRNPVKLLLRIYGPQASHLIDREKELGILKRLARKRIGPRLLGTFLNGRFEQFFQANPLSPEDLWDAETSRQIAKRMRELHEGIDLTREERSAGPFVWQNWDKWVKRSEEVITWLDQQISSHNGSTTSRTDGWKSRGLVCGVPWSQFSAAVYRYRQWLKEIYGGGQGLRNSLVFAHNDYGNILRIEPAGESPLLLPSNEHKQLIVIDFEYANANTRGYEFVNHFTEWCYNYHTDVPWKCNTDKYPRPEEQARFIKAYMLHDSKYHVPTTIPGSELPSTSLATFMLDARVPPNSSYTEEENSREEDVETQISQFMYEARLWRVANSAQWVAWGIVQAKVEGMEEALSQARGAHNITAPAATATATATATTPTTAEDRPSTPPNPTSHPPHEHETDDNEQGFDYLAYAQDRALFFWGDMLELGLVTEDQLPDEVCKRAKRLKY